MNFIFAKTAANSVHGSLPVLFVPNKSCYKSIGEKLLLKTNSLSPLIKRMEKIGLLNRTGSVKDERGVLVKLRLHRFSEYF